MIGAAVFGVLSIGRPIHQITEMLLKLAAGARGLTIPYTTRGDEIGDAARAAQTFQDNLMRLEALEGEQKDAAAKLVAERQKMVRDIADEFDIVITAVLLAGRSASRSTNSVSSSPSPASPRCRSRSRSTFIPTITGTSMPCAPGFRRCDR